MGWILEKKGIRHTFESLGIRVITVGDTGTPNILNITQEHAYTDGSSFQRSRIPTRFMSITGQLYGNSLSDLHSKRATISSLLQPEYDGTPINLIYTGGSEEVYIPARYESGFNFNNTPHWFQDVFTLRFMCTYPFWRSTTEIQQDFLASNTAFINQYSLLVLYEETETLIASVKSAATTIFNATTGDVYIGSEDTVTGTNYLVKIDATTGAEIVISGLNGAVWTVVESSTGEIYIGGDFTTPANHIAQIDGNTAIAIPSTPTLTANALSVRGMAISEKSLYTSFLVVGVPNTGNNIYYISNPTITTSTSVAGNNPIKTLVTNRYIQSAGSVADVNCIIGGDFDYTYTVNNGFNTSVLSSYGDLTDSSSTKVRRLRYIGNDLYACGQFDNADGTESNCVAIFNGAYWRSPFVIDNISPIEVENVLPYRGGVALTGTMNLLAVQGTSRYFTEGSVIYKNGLKRFSHQLYAKDNSYNEYIDADNVYYPGFYVNVTQARGELGYLTVTYAGKKPVKPIIRILRKNLIFYIHNKATNKTIYLNNYYDVFSLIIDCFNGKVTDLSGREIPDAILPGSDFDSFELVPGSNVLIASRVLLNPLLEITYHNEYWGFDT